MTSVSQQQLRKQRQVDLMLALGEAVIVEDPETGVAHYMATQRLLTMMEVEGERCDAGLGEPHRPRHAKEAHRGWRVRTALVVLAGGVIMIAAMPSAVSMAGRPGVHRVIDDDVDPDDSPPPPPAKNKVKAVTSLTTRVARPVRAAAAVTPKRSKIADMFASGRGRHRAGHYSDARSNRAEGKQRERREVWFPSQVDAVGTASREHAEQMSEHTHRAGVFARR